MSERRCPFLEEPPQVLVQRARAAAEAAMPQVATKTIQIWADTKGKARCRGCHAPIEWATVVASGRKMPFDGQIVALSTHHDPETRRLVEVVDLSTNHWATCSERKQFKR